MSTLAHTVERSIILDADPERVREALADESFLAEWLGTEVELDEAPAEEAERLSFHWHREGWGESQVELIVDAVAAGARVTVIETSLEPGASPLLAAAWSPPLARLRRRLAVGRLALA